MLASLTYTPTGEYEGSDTLNLSVTSTDGSNTNAIIATASTAITVNPAAEAPVLAATDAIAVSSSVNEDGTVALTITPHFESDADATNTITISNLTAGANLSNDVGALTPVNGVYTLSVADLAGLTLTAPDGDLASISMNVQAHASEGSTSADSATQTITVNVNPVAEAPSLTVVDASGAEDGPIALSINPALSADVDADASLSLTIGGIPADATLSNTQGDTLTVGNDGSISFTSAQLAAGVLNGLAITPHSADDAGFQLTVTATTTDGTGPDASTASSTGHINVAVTPVADPPVLTVSEDVLAASVNKAALLGIGATLVESGAQDADASLSVTIGGIPADATLSNTQGDTLTVGNDGSISFTSAQLAAGVLNGLAITPLSASDPNFTLHVTATDADGTSTQSTSHDIAVAVYGEILTVSEDQSVHFGISSTLASTLSSDSSLSLVIGNIPADATLTNDGGPLTVDNTGSVTFTHDEINAGALSGLSITAHSADGPSFHLATAAITTVGANASTPENILFNVTPVADAPSLTVADASGAEDGPIALSINPALSADVDADASLSLTIGGIPADATLSNTQGDTLTVGNDGSISFTSAQLAAGVLNGLAITPHSADDAGFQLTVTATTTDGTGPDASTASSTGHINVTVTPVADAPSLTVADASGAEDGPIALSINPALSADVDADASLSLTIGGIPADATLSNTQGDTLTVGNDGSISFTSAQLAAGVLNGLAITPHSADDAGFQLTVTATTTDGTGPDASTASSTGHINVTVTPVADAPSLTVADASGAEDGPIALSINPALSADVDADASLSLTIGGIPADATLSNTQGDTLTVGNDGSISFTSAQLAAGVLNGLAITPHSADDAGFQLTVTATTTDGTGPDASTASSTGHINVTVTPVADAPSLTVADASGAEDGPIALSINPALSADVDADASLSLTIGGIPADATLSNTQGDTLTVGNDGSISFTSAQLAAGVLNGLAITPHSADDAGFQLTVTATTTDGTGPDASTASTVDYINVAVDPVAEAPVLTGTVLSASGNEDTPIGLTITNALSDDNDPDATLGVVTISGVPVGVSLSAGTSTDAGNGTTTWTLNPVDLAGLTLTGDGEATNFVLHVDATAIDGGSDGCGPAPSSIAHAGADLTVAITSVAAAPVLAASDAVAMSSSVNEDATVALTITPHFEADADATNTITISNLTAGANLNNNVGVLTPDDNGVYTLSVEDLAGLTLKVPDSDLSSISMQVQAHASEGSSSADSAIQTISVTINPVAEAPVLGGSASTTVAEGGAVTLGATDTIFDSDDTLSTVTVSGLPDDLTHVNGGTYDAVHGTWTGTAAQFNALTFNAGETAGTFNLSVSATTTGAEAGTTTASYTLTVNAGAEGPVLGGTTSVTVAEGGAVTLGATDTIFDSDDTLSTVTVSGLPGDLTHVNGGTYDAVHGTWTGTAAQFNALIFNAGETAGTFNLSVSATTTGAEAGTTTASYTLTVNAGAEGPVLGGTTSVTVAEGGAVTLGATDTIFDSDDTLSTVTVSGLPDDLTHVNGGTYDAVHGTWTGTAAQFNALTFNAGETAGTFNLSVSATTTGAEAGTTTASYTLTITPPNAGIDGEPVDARRGVGRPADQCDGDHHGR